MFTRFFLAAAVSVMFCSKCIGVEFNVTQIADISPGPAGSSPRDFFEFNGELLFNSFAGLAKTDGHSVTVISNISPGYPVGIYGNEVYFVGPDWIRKTDGMTLTEIDGPGIGYEGYFSEFRDELFFGGGGRLQRGLHRTDGNSVTTISDILPNGSGNFVEFAGHLYFEHFEETTSVFRTDGDVVTAFKGVDQQEVTTLIGEYRDELYLANGTTLFKTDGDSAVEVGTFGIPGDFRGSLSITSVFADELYFALINPDWFGGQVFKTDGATLSPVVGYPVDLGLDLIVYGDMVELSGHLLFPGVTENGPRLVKTDGHTVMEVPNVDASSNYVYPDAFTLVGDELFFIAQDTASPEFGHAIYKTDGEFVSRVADARRPAGGRLGPMPTLQDHVFFASDINGRTVLTATDGTSVVQFPNDREGEAIELFDSPNPFVGLDFELETAGGTLFFDAIGPDGRELYMVTVVPEPDCLQFALLFVIAFWRQRMKKGEFARSDNGRCIRSNNAG